MKHTPWLTRKFTFDYPVTHFPFFLERLRGVHPRLVNMTANGKKELLEKKEGERWSVKEHIGHLIDLEELHESRIDDYLHGIGTLHAADMSNTKTYAASHNSKSLEDLLNAFRLSREQFIRHLLELDESRLSLSALHPRLQKQMRLVDMVFFVAEHDDHHLTMIRELLK